MDNFFTIIIPTFNRKEFLTQAVNSVLNQSFKNWYLHIVDNTSTDGTEDYLKSLLKDKRIRYSIIDNNGIIAKSRNYALKRVTSKAVAFLDDDDIWLPNKLQADFELLNLGYSLVYSKASVFYDDSIPIKNLPIRKLGINPLRNMLIYGNTFITSSVTFLYEDNFKNIIFNESKDFLTWEDYDLWIRLLEKGIKPIRNNKTTVLYRISSFQNTNAKREIKNISSISKNFQKYYEKYNINTFHGVPIWAHYSYVICFLKLKKYKLAIYSIFNIFKISCNLKDYIYSLRVVLRFLFEFFNFKK